MAEKNNMVKVKFLVKTAEYNQGLLNEKHVPIHSYFLYLFWKQDDEYKLFLQTDDKNKKLKVAGKHIPVVAKPDVANSELCDYPFVRKETYYGCFSGKELDVNALKTIAMTSPERLIHIYPTGSTYKIDHSFFYWLMKAAELESDTKTSHENINLLLETLEKKTDVNEDEKWIIDNQWCTLPNNQCLDIKSALTTIKNKLSNPSQTIQAIFDSSLNETMACYKTIEIAPTRKACSKDQKWSGAIREGFSHHILTSNLRAHLIAPTLSDKNTVTGDLLKSFSDNNISNDLTNLFYKDENNSSIGYGNVNILNTLTKSAIQQYGTNDAQSDSLDLKPLERNIFSYVDSVAETNSFQYDWDSFDNAKRKILFEFGIDLNSYSNFFISLFRDALECFEQATLHHEKTANRKFNISPYNVKISYSETEKSETGAYELISASSVLNIKSIIEHTTENTTLKNSILFLDGYTNQHIFEKNEFSIPKQKEESISASEFTAQTQVDDTVKFIELIPFDQNLVTYNFLKNETGRKRQDSTIVPISAWEKLRAKLETENFPMLTMDAFKHMRLTGANLAIPKFERFQSSTGQYVAPDLQSATDWVGNQGETGFFTKNTINSFYEDLNNREWRNRAGTWQGSGNQNNFPVYDALGKFVSNKLISIKASGGGASDNQNKQRDVRRRYWETGFKKTFGGHSNPRHKNYRNFNNVAIQPDNLNTNRADAIYRSYLAINSDDVASFRENLKNSADANIFNRQISGVNDLGNRAVKHKLMYEFFNIILEKENIKLNGVRIPTLEALFAQPSGTNINSVTEKLKTILAKRIISNGRTNAEVRNSIHARIGTGRLGRLQPYQYNYVTSEYIYVKSQASTIKASLKSAGRNAAYGSIFTTILSGHKLLTKDGENTGDDYLKFGSDIALGIVGDAVSSAGETGVLSRGLVQGTGIIKTFGRTVGKSFTSGLAAPIVEVGTMLFEDHYLNTKDYSYTDYSAKGTRAAVGGIFAAGAGAVGTLIFPGIGTIAGMAIGYGAYMVYELLAGQAIEDGVRSVLSEETEQPSVSAKKMPLQNIVGNVDYTTFKYFRIIHQKFTIEDNILVQPTGTYISMMYPEKDDEDVYLQVKVVNTRQNELFDSLGDTFLIPTTNLMKSKSQVGPIV
ncbi:MAG: hypothetical protein ABUK01_07895 [Leptospirales bacterium]